jgi:mono/diheme cytochrome c family protein
MKWALALLAAGLVAAFAETRGDDEFEKHVRPLLADRCVKCHGPAKQSGGLRLDSRAALLKGGESGPAAVSGKPDQSLMLAAVGYQGETKMPPKGRLKDAEIAQLRDWVGRGLPWRDSSSTASGTAAKPGPSEDPRKWWAFQPLRAPEPPDVRDVSWPASDIDRFILAELEARALLLARPADRRTLLRRASFDLTGLPPSAEELEAFLRDDSPSAFTKVVDRLLEAPAYGQLWARHWLDVVRYADYHDGNPKARNPVCEPLEAWRYRDWVVRSFNRDLPFDQFIRHQIAGDLLPAPDGKEPYVDGLVATTFLVNGAWDRGDADKEKMVSDMVDDQVDTVGKAFLGLTLGCARCHDHKFDPVTQADYYALAGIFYSTRMLTELGIKGGEITLQRRVLVPQSVVDRRNRQVTQIAGLNAILADLDKKSPRPQTEDPTRQLLIETRDRVQAELLPEPPLALAVSEGGVPGGLFPGIQDVPIHIRGSYTRLGPVVPRGVPKFLSGARPPKIARGSGRRELADWIATRDNPLTARVIVNRVWQWHFGTGLVRTPNNFGRLSEPPAHPALLDWLAARFIEDGWSLKSLHRRIMLSATYRQASEAPREQVAHDPENRWLGRFTPHRLDAEAIRDAMLFASGRLDLAEGGPATDDLNTTRRSLYVQTARWDRSSFATLFDAANPDAAVERRDVSTVAPQALFLMNNAFTLAQAEHLARRAAREEPTNPGARIERLFRLAFSRPARSEEHRIAARLLGPVPVTSLDPWRDLAHVLLCSNEFVYVD